MDAKVDIFYVEDNEDYVNFVGRVVKKLDNNISYQYITDGKAAFDYLVQPHDDRPPAKLILLDLNLPGMSGIDLLCKIRSMPSLKDTPVVIFSTSDDPEDVKKSYENGANAYLVKPSGLLSLTETMKQLVNFWLIPGKLSN